MQSEIGGIIVFTSTYLKQEIVINEIITVHYFEYNSDFYFPGESHGFWEFLYVDKGEVEVTAGDTDYVLNKGDIIFHKPYEFHRLWANGVIAPNLVVISFKCSSSAIHFFDNKILHINNYERDLLGKIITEADTAFSSNLNDPDLKELKRSSRRGFACEQIIKVCLELMLISLIRNSNNLNEKVTSNITEKSDEGTFSKVTAYLSDNISNKITLNDVCRDNMCCRSYLQKIFNQKTGGGVMEYFGKLRIDCAKQKIREGLKNFTQISNELGYSSVYYFSRHFKKVTGMTPSEYSSSVKLHTEKQKKRPIIIEKQS